ncbi:MAG: prephenate dehydratase [Bacteroides sp.]|nr:prephenate dehydratase [Bacteroides sp.]MBD5352620.1 prephenate dehydratase [Bacteroides sp.]MBD5362317.1 prephenate dehydratase [Bacteroides sp.]
MRKREIEVGIQGVAGCFHDAAARSYFAGWDVRPVEYDSFADMFESLGEHPERLGVVAIENTIAGALLGNHELLRRSALTVVGEYKMRISHVLCALAGESLETIREVNSHPMALMQCEDYLRRHPQMKMIEKFDTAGSAREIAREQLRGHAAVCGEFAADLYGLEVLERGIETNKRNFTRFLILADPSRAGEFRAREEMLNKASIVFSLPHTHGALSKVLTIFSFYDINLSKIQSMPLVGREWEYRFYVDLTYDSYFRYRQSIEAVRPLISDLKILGEYREYEEN